MAQCAQRRNHVCLADCLVRDQSRPNQSLPLFPVLLGIYRETANFWVGLAIVSRSKPQNSAIYSGKFPVCETGN